MDVEGVSPKATARIAGVGAALVVFALLVVAIIVMNPKTMMRSDIVVWALAINAALVVGNIVFMFLY